MIGIDWTDLALGAAAGGLGGALFFLGLAFGMRRALRRANPAPLLILSAALRISALLALGWVVAQAGAAALAGFALAFMAARQAAIAWMPAPLGREAPSWS